MNRHRRFRILVIVVLTLAALLTLGTIHPAHAAPRLQEGDEATLCVINESDRMICYVRFCPVGPQDAKDCLSEKRPILPGETQFFEVPDGNYDVYLEDCAKGFLTSRDNLNFEKEKHTIRYEQSSPCDLSSLLGLLYYIDAEYADALKNLEEALVCFEKEGDKQGQIDSLYQIGRTHYQMEQYDNALMHYEKALRTAWKIDNPDMAGNILGSLGEVYLALGQYVKALNYFEQALTIARDINDHQGEGKALGSLGNVYLFIGQYDKAIKYYEQTLAISRSIGDQNMEGSILSNLGGAYRNLGQYAISIKRHEQALNIARDIGDREGERNCLGGLGHVYSLLGQYETAGMYYEQALVITRDIGDRNGESIILNSLGTLHNFSEQSEKALEYTEQALDIARDIGDRGVEGNCLGNIGDAYLSMEQYEKAVESYEQALIIAQDIGDQMMENTALGKLGNAHNSLGQIAEAIKYYKQALVIARNIGYREGVGDWLSKTGIAYSDLGQYEEAFSYYEQSIAEWEMIRGEISVDKWKSSFTAKYLEPYRGIIEVLLELNRPAEAFHYAQRAKARTFLDQVGNVRVEPRATDDPEMIEQEQALLAEIRDLEAVLSGQRSFETLSTRGGPNTLTTEQRNEIQTRLDEAYREYEHLLDRIKLSNPEYADLRAVDASTLITVQQTLPAETTLVEYYVVSDTQTLAFVVTPDAFHTVPLSVSVESLNQKINWFREFTSEEEARATAQTLCDWLFTPVREHIETQAVLIAPHQQLHYLPFDALHDGEHYLVEAYTIGYIPSASLLRYVNAGEQRGRGAGEVLVLGNPVNDAVGPLPAAEREAQAVADLFGASAYLGKAATESRLWEQAEDADYVHLAAHGQFNETAPKFSRVYLAPSEVKNDTVTSTLSSQTDGSPSTHTDGLLETREVWNLRLENADLVTLSACQTQLGELSAGDELVGLSRAFIYAGTPSLVASLWSVEDDSTAYLMEHFYGYIQDGIGKTEALRQAKLDTMEEYPSPYHWAAFTLIGDMGKVEEIDNEDPSSEEEATEPIAREAFNVSNIVQGRTARVIAVITILICVLWLGINSNQAEEST